MDKNSTDLINEVVRRTESELILFFVLLLVALLLICIPLYAMILKDRKRKGVVETTRQENYIKREALMVEVVKQNTSVISELKVTLDLFHKHTNDSFKRIHDRLDIQIQNSENHNEKLAIMSEKINDIKSHCGRQKNS